MPYCCVSATQLRKLAEIATRWDKGFGHLTTRQNMQLNWVALEDAPDILEALASVEMHAIQSSGNCIRNTTSDPFAGAAADELEDPRVYCEIIRQWSSLHPEFSFLPRKFKIAVSGATHDRAAIRFHDIGLRLYCNDAGEKGFEVLVGGGLGRTPFVGKVIRDFLPVNDMLSYLEAILRVYNQLGRRDNKFKARIKILVHEMGGTEFGERVEKEWEQIKHGALHLPQDEIDRIEAYFAPPPHRDLAANEAAIESSLAASRENEPEFDRWMTNNVSAHKRAGYAIVSISVKAVGAIPGDLSSEQMLALADLADRFSFGELRFTHDQNVVLTDVEQSDLEALWRELARHALATGNVDKLTDSICCPGQDYCALANARSIPLAQEISKRFADGDRLDEIGPLSVKMSGCINACGHHHIGNIGILGADKKGAELYQLALGGASDEEASIAKIIGPGFTEDRIVDAVENVVETYLGLRNDGERFIDTYRRVGAAPFKEKLYART